MISLMVALYHELNKFGYLDRWILAQSIEGNVLTNGLGQSRYKIVMIRI